jgi:hypothetical protein
MIDRFERAARGLATGFCFAVFGLGELALSCITLSALSFC